MRRLPTVALLLALCAALLLPGCGKSSETKAKDNACNAIHSIATQVNELSGYTANTVTKAKVQENVAQIRDNLKELKQTLPDVSADLRNQLQKANAAFTTSLNSVVDSVKQGTGNGQAKQQVAKAGDQLATSYKQTFGSVPC